MLDSIARAAAVLSAGRRGVALTGAGVSTESGLPDFRSADGLWATMDPARAASLTAFRRDPTAFYRFYRTRLSGLAGAVPNEGHRALARLEAEGILHLVVTQNVDGLHQQAGSRDVVEVHGNLRECRCTDCGAVRPVGEMARPLEAGDVPRCARCGGLLRPNVVLFEELLPIAAYERAEAACREGDVLLVVGSSLEVYPVAGLPDLAVRSGARLVIVNRDPTPCDPLAEVVVRGNAGTVLPAIVEAVERSRQHSHEEAPMSRDQPRAEIGVFGGSGLYALLDDAREVKVETPYGEPSDTVTIAAVAGRKVAFLPRHGRTHRIPPHRINYRANVWAMKSLGVGWVFGPCAAGSLQPHVKPGEFVVCDQFVDRTNARADTFADGPIVTHIAGADPYCPTLRPLAVETAKGLGIAVHERGTVVVVQGPRFSTRAESRWFQSQGWEVINMTNYPECVLAREAEICYVNVSLITDYDVGVEGDPDVAPVTQEAVMQVLRQNNEKFRQLLFAIMERLPRVRTCSCATALAHARVE